MHQGHFKSDHIQSTILIHHWVSNSSSISLTDCTQLEWSSLCWCSNGTRPPHWLLLHTISDKNLPGIYYCTKILFLWSCMLCSDSSRSILAWIIVLFHMVPVRHLHLAFVSNGTMRYNNLNQKNFGSWMSRYIYMQYHFSAYIEECCQVGQTRQCSDWSWLEQGGPIWQWSGSSLLHPHQGY